MDELDPERWAHIEAILDEALELDPAGRRRLLDDACAGDPDLRARVEALLDADAHPRELVLDVPPHAYAGSLLQRGAPGHPGARPSPPANCWTAAPNASAASSAGSPRSRRRC